MLSQHYAQAPVSVSYITSSQNARTLGYVKLHSTQLSTMVKNGWCVYGKGVHAMIQCHSSDSMVEWAVGPWYSSRGVLWMMLSHHYAQAPVSVSYITSSQHARTLGYVKLHSTQLSTMVRNGWCCCIWSSDKGVQAMIQCHSIDAMVEWAVGPW